MVVSIRDEWKRNARALTGRETNDLPAPEKSPPPKPALSSRTTNMRKVFAESYAQVAPSVLHPVAQKSCGLKPESVGGKKSEVRSIRFQAGELVIVEAKAVMAGVSINSYIRAAALGSDYEQPMHPELRKALLATNRELTAHGNNLNQIAKHLNMGQITPDRAVSMLDAIRHPLVRTLMAVKKALAQGAAPY